MSKLESNHWAYRAEKPRGRAGFSQMLISTFTFPQNFDSMSVYCDVSGIFLLRVISTIKAGYLMNKNTCSSS